MPKSISSYRVHKPSGQAVVTLNGRDHYLGPWPSAESKAQYDRLIGENRLRVLQPNDPDS